MRSLPVSDLSADLKRMKIIKAIKHAQKAIARKLTGPSLSKIIYEKPLYFSFAKATVTVIWASPFPKP